MLEKWPNGDKSFSCYQAARSKFVSNSVPFGGRNAVRTDPCNMVHDTHGATTIAFVHVSACALRGVSNVFSPFSAFFLCPLGRFYVRAIAGSIFLWHLFALRCRNENLRRDNRFGEAQAVAAFCASEGLRGYSPDGRNARRNRER